MTSLCSTSQTRIGLAFTDDLPLLNLSNQAILPHLGPDHVPVVFTRNFAHILSSNLIKKDNYLHAAARKCMVRGAKRLPARKLSNPPH